jgi:hypothetical protein
VTPLAGGRNPDAVSSLDVSAVPAADSAGMRPKHLSDYMQSLVTGVWPGRGDHRATFKINDHPWHAAPVIHIFCSILPQVAFACPLKLFAVPDAQMRRTQYCRTQNPGNFLTIHFTSSLLTVLHFRP